VLLESPHPIWSLLGVLFFALNIAAGLIWYERRLLGLWQDRYGPNRVGPFGLLQVLADMVKIFTKEDWIPPFADKWVFIGAPAIVVATVLMGFVVVPFTSGIVVADLNIGLLFFLAMSSLGVYSVVLGGWSSDNKYALLGGLRAAAQMLSYEVFMGLAVMGTVILAGTFSLGGIVEAQARTMWFIIPQFLGFVLFLIAGVAETRRLPFDLPEAESELVAGFHSEYSGMKFGMFFVGEYLGLILISSLITVLFLGGWLGPGLPGLVWFLIKMFGFISFFILLRAALPRPRFDQLMAWGWKLMLPLALANLLVTGAIVVASNGAGPSAAAPRVPLVLAQARGPQSPTPALRSLRGPR
jgi:NADH-quinone oxidoreductase subunit H